jgi:hypothetical protein
MGRLFRESFILCKSILRTDYACVPRALRYEKMRRARPGNEFRIRSLTCKEEEIEGT